METLVDLKARLQYSAYKANEVSFEFITEDEIATFITTTRERPQPDHTIYRWPEQALLTINVNSGAITGSTDVKADDFSTNLNGMLVANPSANLVAVFDPKSPAPITLWNVDRSAASTGGRFIRRRQPLMD